jgi:type I restriction enzyme S subunit
MTQTEVTPTAAQMGKWKPYPAYKNSGVEWLGEIPAHWEVMRLKFIANEPLKYGANESADLDDPHLPRYIRITDIGEDGSLRNDTYKSLPEEIAEPFLLKSGDLLFARSGATVGKSILYQESWGKACYAGYLIRLRINPRISNPHFISYFVTSTAYQNWLSSVFIQATIQNVSAEKYANLYVTVPSLAEQRSIADFLDRETAKINTLITKKERLIELLQEKRAALISHTVTKGLDPTVPMKDSRVEWLGEIPAHWEVKQLKFVADVLTGVAKGRDLGQKDVVELPYLRVANVQDGYLDLSDIATIIVGADEVERYSLKYGDVLMNEGGDFDKLGRGYVWEETIAPCLHQNHVFAVRPHFGVDPYWISIITLTSYAKHFFILKSKQSTNLASISGTNLKELPVLMPQDGERNEILLYINDKTAKCDSLISKIQEDIEKLKEYSTALISAVVTGKIDVRDTSIDDNIL